MSSDNPPSTDAESIADDHFDTSINADLQSRPCLVAPGREVPAEVVVSNLAWDTIRQSFVGDIIGFVDFPTPVRTAIEDEVEHHGYRLLGLSGFSLDIDTSDTMHEMTLEVALTGGGESGDGVEDDA